MIDLKTPNAAARVCKISPAVEFQTWTIQTPPGHIRLKSPHFHDEYQIGFLTDGVVENTYRRVRQTIMPQQLYLIEPGEVHAESVVQGPELRFSFAFVAPKQLRQVAEDITDGKCRLADGRPLLVADAAVNRQLVAHTAAYFSLLEQPQSPLEQEMAQFNWLAALIANRAETAVADKKPGDEHREIAAVKACLHDCFSEPVSLNKLADLACLSKYHLSRTFVRVTGMTISQYQTHLRICRAKTLLRQGKQIAEVALELGFSDQAHFGHCFKRFTSQTPGRF